MTLRPRYSFRRLLRDSEGVTAVEFAFIAPIFLLTVLGIMEVSMIAFATSLLEGGLREAARFGITGLAANNGSREQRIVEIINEHGAGIVTVSPVDVTTRTYANFTDIGDPEPYVDTNGDGSYSPGEPFTDVNCSGAWEEDMGQSGAGDGGDVVIYEVLYEHRLMTGVLLPIFGQGGKFPISASVAVRNEPFGSGTPTC